jgi:hypothetical protein
MKTTLILCALACNAFAALPVLVRVTPKTLADLQARDPMIRLVKPEEGEAKVARPVNESIIKESTILHDGSHWTLVPNDAVMFLPESLKARVNVRPVGTLLPWSDFLRKNRTWLVTSEVSFDEAAGNQEIPAERTAQWAGEEKIVVAVHRQGPISVRVAKPIPALTQR